jgi:hypothetical protein
MRFLSTVTLIVYIGVLFQKKVQAELIKSYKEGLHLPEIADIIGYWSIIVMYAGFGYFYIAFCWAFTAAVDFHVRELSKK